MKKILLTLSLFLFLSTDLFAAIGKLLAVKGEVYLIRNGVQTLAKAGTTIDQNDQVITKKDGKTQIRFTDKTTITIGKNSDFKVESYVLDTAQPSKSNASFKFGNGLFRTITGQIGKINKERFKIKTKSASIGIRGTIFLVEVKPNQLRIGVEDGGVFMDPLDQGISPQDIGKNQVLTYDDKTKEFKVMPLSEWKEVKKMQDDSKQLEDDSTDNPQDDSDSQDENNDEDEDNDQNNKEDDQQDEDSQNKNNTQDNNVEQNDENQDDLGGDDLGGDDLGGDDLGGDDLGGDDLGGDDLGTNTGDIDDTVGSVEETVDETTTEQTTPEETNIKETTPTATYTVNYYTGQGYSSSTYDYIDQAALDSVIMDLEADGNSITNVTYSQPIVNVISSRDYPTGLTPSAVPSTAYGYEGIPNANLEYVDYGYWLDIDGNDLAGTNGTYAFGDITDTATIQNKLDVDPVQYYKGDYSGSVIGFVGENRITNGSINLYILYSNNVINGNMSFNSSGTAWSGVIENSNNMVTSSGFNADISLSNTGGTSTGTIEGSFYGPNADEIGGKFNASGAGGSVNGAFIAEKTYEGPGT